MGLENLNRLAEKTFDSIKRKKGWTSRIVEEVAKSDDSINVEKLQKMLDTPPIRMEVEDYVKHHDAKFSSAEVSPMAFVDSLGLPANLSIAVACLIEYGKKKNKNSLASAQEYIMKELKNE